MEIAEYAVDWLPAREYPSQCKYVARMGNEWSALPANLCPIHCGGTAGRPRSRRTILHNDSAAGKRFLRQLVTKPQRTAQTTFREHSQVRELDRTEKMMPIHGTASASSNGEPLLRIGRYKTTSGQLHRLRRNFQPNVRVARIPSGAVARKFTTTGPADPSTARK